MKYYVHTQCMAVDVIWLADMLHATGLQATWRSCSPVGVKNQNGVNVKAHINLAIGFPLFLELEAIVKG